MNQAVIERLRGELQGLTAQGLYKKERVLGGPQGGVVQVAGHDVVLLEQHRLRLDRRLDRAAAGENARPMGALGGGRLVEV